MTLLTNSVVQQDFVIQLPCEGFLEPASQWKVAALTLRSGFEQFTYFV